MKKSFNFNPTLLIWVLVIGFLLYAGWWIENQPDPVRNEVTIFELAANEVNYHDAPVRGVIPGKNNGWERVWTQGVILVETNDCFVLVSNPLPEKENFSEDDYVVVCGVLPEGVGIGSVINLVGGWISDETVRVDNETTTLYYLHGYSNVERVGTIDTTSAPFVDLATIVDGDGPTSENGALNVLITYILLRPNGLLRP